MTDVAEVGPAGVRRSPALSAQVPGVGVEQFGVLLQHVRPRGTRLRHIRHLGTIANRGCLGKRTSHPEARAGGAVSPPS
ncbi:hypothetical protein GCM10009740_29010 [Terrabacter terrae]|uniref:Uncharacterized protein n=1 Tax=Terrabacter terrae TaxID=318434 RepID=A0ABN2UHU5_9MICO